MSTPGVSLEHGSPVPLYHQLARQLEDAVTSGRLAKGEFLANELDLAEAWRVSRPTVRRAIQELVDAGLLIRRRGVGTQVVNDQVRRSVRLSSLYDDLQETHRIPSTEVLRHERLPAPARVADALDVPTGEQVVHVERCRLAGTARLAILRNWLTVERAGDITTEELNEHGLYDLLRQRGVRPHRATQRIGATTANEHDAAILGLPAGAALLTMRRVMQDDTGTTVELGEHVYDGSQYSVETTVIES